MKSILAAVSIVLASFGAVLGSEPAQQRVTQVAETKGLIAFWDFSLMKDGKWTSYHDQAVVDHGYPVVLRRIGDPKPYAPTDWPYQDEQSKLTFDSSGPFGQQTARTPATKFAHLRKKMEKARIMSKISKKK
jgi:hypothetical protein